MAKINPAKGRDLFFFAHQIQHQCKLCMDAKIDHPKLLKNAEHVLALCLQPFMQIHHSKHHPL
ncbi:MAG: hypothetical protein HYV29_14555 [Ignavibacteriales bacterium]|nr:hypothetical protein [Ignavibacteriales bacterium]